MSVQVPAGTVDIAVADEAEAVAVPKKYLSYFQGALPEWRAADQRLLRRAIPENRLRVYDVRDVIDTLCDEGSVLELRRAFGPGMVTALARVEGKPFGIVANNPTHLAGAIDSDGSDKAARFLQLCDAFDLPILFLCDTPGMMVGPEIEKTALVRHCSRLFVTGANLGVPFGTIVLRKAYGLGAQRDGGRLVPCRDLRASPRPIRRVRRHGAGGRGYQARLPARSSRERSAIRRAAGAVRQDGGRRPMRAARRSARRPTSRSTRSSTPLIRGGGSRRRCWAPNDGRARITRGGPISTRGRAEQASLSPCNKQRERRP